MLYSNRGEKGLTGTNRSHPFDLSFSVVDKFHIYEMLTMWAISGAIYRFDKFWLQRKKSILEIMATDETTQYYLG